MIRIALFCLAAAAPLAAGAQAFPSRPLHLVTVFAAGSTGDVNARVISRLLGGITGQPVIVDNMAGAGGVLAAEKVARSAPDGYTVLYSLSGVHVSRIYLARSTPFDPVNDFTPITLVSEAISILVTHPSVPVGSFRELIEYAKANPGKIAYGTAGVGSPHHLAGVLIAQLAGIDWVHVPYKAAATSLQDVIAGQIPTTFAQGGFVIPAMRAGKVKVLAIMGGSRYEAIPDVPTIGELLPGYEPPPGWSGILGPAKLPAPILGRLHADITKVLDSKESRAEQAKIFTQTAISASPEEFAEKIRREVELVGQIVKRAGIQPLD